MESLTKVRIQGSPIALAQWEKQGAGWTGSRDCLRPQLVHGQGLGPAPKLAPQRACGKYKLCPSLLLLCPLAGLGRHRGFLGKDWYSLCLLEESLKPVSHGPGPAGTTASREEEGLWSPWVLWGM